MSDQQLQLASKTLVVLPTYNEANNLEALINQIQSGFPGVHVYVVDDNSPDGTGKLADRIAERSSFVHVEHRPAKLGLGTAYRFAFTQPIIDSFDYIIQMDSDFSHEPEQIPNFVKELSGNSDFVIGSRYMPGGNIPNWSVGRKLLSRFGNLYIRFMMGVPIADCTSGYRGFTQKSLKSLNVLSVKGEGYIFIAAMAKAGHNKKLKMKEIPITFNDRAAGKSKMSNRIIAESLFLATKFGIQRVFQRNRDHK
jgi:dolichol-phosphate mannosyltransferase